MEEAGGLENCILENILEQQQQQQQQEESRPDDEKPPAKQQEALEQLAQEQPQVKLQVVQ